MSQASSKVRRSRCSSGEAHSIAVHLATNHAHFVAEEEASLRAFLVALIHTIVCVVCSKLAIVYTTINVAGLIRLILWLSLDRSRLAEFRQVIDFR